MLKREIENKRLTLYVQRSGSEVWHDHPSCPHFQKFENDPDARTVASAKRPGGKGCELCEVKARRESER